MPGRNEGGVNVKLIVRLSPNLRKSNEFTYKEYPIRAPLEEGSYIAIKEDDVYEIKFIKAKIPKECICPDCCQEQPFKKYHEHWKRVKDLSLNKPTILICTKTEC